MASTLLTLVRHGQSIWNAVGRSQGHAPVPLSEIGREQARYLAAALAKNDGFRPITALYSSDLLRCRQTAAPIVEALGLDVRYDSRLREIDSGTWQGLTWEERRAYDPENTAAFEADPLGVQIPGGESHPMMVERVLSALREILDGQQGEHILLVIHGGPIYTILDYFGLWPGDGLGDGGVSLYNTARTVLEVDEAGRTAQVHLLADVSHLLPGLVT